MYANNKAVSTSDYIPVVTKQLSWYQKTKLFNILPEHGHSLSKLPSTHETFRANSIP